jgi:hypothetical protein
MWRVSWEFVALLSGGVVAFFSVVAVLALYFAATGANERTAQLELALEKAKQETLLLQKDVAWRRVDEKQETILAQKLTDQKVEGHFIVLNWNDPEQSQYYTSIAGTCGKMNIVCKLYPSKASYPALFPPPGLLSFAFDDAEQTFTNAFKAAGLVTGRVGTSVGAMMFPEGIKEGIIIGPKPSPLGPEAWRTNSPPPR